jgi:DNA-binding NarL/FixJ family response regulator
MGDTMRVSVCDDARAVKMFLRHVLEEEGDMEVVSETSTGRAALDALGRDRPDALLLDLLLPDVADAGVLVAQLRERSPATAIVLISNMPASDLRDEATRVGADAWMLKAQKPEQMRAGIREAVGGRGEGAGVSPRAAAGGTRSA